MRIVLIRGRVPGTNGGNLHVNVDNINFIAPGPSGMQVHMMGGGYFETDNMGVNQLIRTIGVNSFQEKLSLDELQETDDPTVDSYYKESLNKQGITSIPLKR